MNDFVYSIPTATFSLNGQCLQIIQPTFGRLAFDAADDAAKRILLAQAQANQSYPGDRKAWFLEYTERASDLDMKMPNENLALVRSSSARSTVEDDILAVLRRSVRRFFFDESDIAAVQLAFAALRKEKNAGVRETLNGKTIDGSTASIEIQILSVEDDHDVTFKSAWFHLTSHNTIEDVLSHPTSHSDVMLEYSPNIGILSRSIAEETQEEVALLAKRHQVLRAVRGVPCAHSADSPYRKMCIPSGPNDGRGILISSFAPIPLSAWVVAFLYIGYILFLYRPQLGWTFLL